MKHLILAGLLAVPVALVSCKSGQDTVASAEASVVTLEVTGMT